MITMTVRLTPSTQMMLAATTLASQSSPVRVPTAHQHDSDPDERRWQLEWERRNVED